MKTPSYSLGSQPDLRTLLRKLGAVSSNTEYNRYIKTGSIKVLVAGWFQGVVQKKQSNYWECRQWVKITDPNYVPEITDIIKIGKRKIYRCELEWDSDDAPKTLKPVLHLDKDETPTDIPKNFNAIHPIEI